MRMNEKQLEAWSKTRQLGRDRFVWRLWVLGWGLLTGLFWSIFMAYQEGWRQLPVFLVLAWIGFPLGGYFLGRWMWRFNERNYQRTLAG